MFAMEYNNEIIPSPLDEVKILQQGIKLKKILARQSLITVRTESRKTAYFNITYIQKI